jgi:hypothetical protein
MRLLRSRSLIVLPQAYARETWLDPEVEAAEYTDVELEELSEFSNRNLQCCRASPAGISPVSTSLPLIR